MKLFIDHFPEPRNLDTPSNALQSWYDCNPPIQRLWAVESQGEDGTPELCVFVMLEPSPDSDETDPIWMARRAQWSLDLSQRLGMPVRLERTEISLPAAFGGSEGGQVRIAQCWRDPASLP